MRKAIVTPVVAGLIGFGLLAAPLAAHAADTPTTFEVSGGALGITVPTTSVDLGTVTVGASDVSASLGTVSVSDQRATVSGSWIATVTSSAFVTGEASTAETVPASDVNYAPGDPSDAVNGTYTPGTAGALGGDTALTAMSTSDEVGVGGVSWDPTITVTLPAQVVAGTYTGTITHSVA
jgi:hypothetical protein